MPNLQPQTLVALIGLAGVIVGFLLRGVGVWLWRLVTKGAISDRAALMGTMADTIAKMRETGVSQDDLDRFEHYLKGKARPDLAISGATAANLTVDTTSIEYFENGMEPFDPNTQAAMNMVAEAKAIDIEAHINARLRHLKFLANEGDGEAIDQAQAAWVSYRDAQAKVAVEPFAGGSIRHLIWWSEVRVASVARLKQIDSEIAQRESDATI